MTKDNVTGKNKDFYDLGKKIFDRLNPQGSITPEIPKARTIEAKLKERNSTSERSIQISDSKPAESSQP